MSSWILLRTTIAAAFSDSPSEIILPFPFLKRGGDPCGFPAATPKRSYPIVNMRTDMSSGLAVNSDVVTTPSTPVAA